jgi:hypothetical protein
MLSVLDVRVLLMINTSRRTVAAVTAETPGGVSELGRR